MYWHQSLLLRGFDEHDSTVLLPFSFGYDRVLHVANVFPLTGPELTSAETCHPIRYSILRVYYYRNIFMLFSTALNSICFIRHNLCSIDANLLMGRKAVDK